MDARQGAASAAGSSPAATAALVLLAPDPMTAGAFFAYKVAFAVALGAVVTPLLAIRAMMPAVPSAPPGSA